MIANTIGNLAAERVAAHGAPMTGSSRGDGFVEKGGIVLNQDSINSAINGLRLVELDTSLDPYRGVMSIDEALAYNAQVDANSIGVEIDGSDMYPTTAKIYTGRSEL